ncbi:nucleotidyltransferase domain-containing protein [Desertihabitans aurantiacus]|uniref:nucleotidyltransferase domain-containing protein n=1 Tax=Desertihabitans aurantiacus TaxID=2282477 RepID=UPI0018E59E6F|nr:nucleotidyltransferase domain-containing protein [Desertihabitans aurantiacus]
MVRLDLPAHLTARQRALLEDAERRLSAELGPALLGLVLSGSAGRGLATEHSDLDLLVVMTPEAAQDPAAPWLHTAELEQIPLALDHLEEIAPYGSPEYAYRWSYAWAPVLADATGGRIAAALERQTHLSTAETVDVLIGHGRIGAWLNLTFRALKSVRAGRPLQARLDAVEALPYFLDVVFALDGLVRPYNSSLPWALAAHPLPSWSGEDLLGLVEGMLDGQPDAVRAGVQRVEERALRFADEHDVGAVREAFDEWRPDDYGVVLGLPPSA